MVKGRFLPLLILALNMAVLGGMCAIPGIAAEVPRIAKEELKSKLGTPVVILDVRGAKQWGASGRKIKGAVWEDPENVESWADKYPKDKTLVLY